MKNKLNKSTFNVPENYFEQLQEKVILQANKQVKTPSFQVPDDTYFNQLEKNILSKTVEKKKSTRQIYLRITGIAASLVIGMVVSLYPLIIKEDKQLVTAQNDSQIVDSIQTDVYQTIYKHYFTDSEKKSPAETADDGDDFYSDKPLYTYY